MRNVNPTEVPAGAQLIDVREDSEWATEHAAGATHIPMGEIIDRVGELDSDEPVYVICHSGGRSLQVAAYLEQNFGLDTVNVVGGTDNWKASGREMA